MLVCIISCLLSAVSTIKLSNSLSLYISYPLVYCVHYRPCYSGNHKLFVNCSAWFRVQNSEFVRYSCRNRKVQKYNRRKSVETQYKKQDREISVIVCELKDPKEDVNNYIVEYAKYSANKLWQQMLQDRGKRVCYLLPFDNRHSILT